MAGDNSLYSAVRKDTAEMIRGKGLIPENINVIIYIDDKGQKPAIFELSAKNGMQLWKQYDEEQCSTDPEVMLEALRTIEYYFPARHYGITFWSHATGWTPRRKTFGKDETYGQSAEKSEMEIPVMRDVLAQLPKFDYIFFDACFMQCVEVAYELRHVTDFLIGSPAEIPGDGAPYDIILPQMCQLPATKQTVAEIVKGYGDYYVQGEGSAIYQGVELSACATAHLEALAMATKLYIPPLFCNRSTPDCTAVQHYNPSLRSSVYAEFYDLEHLIYSLQPWAEAEWFSALDEAVFCKYGSNYWMSAIDPKGYLSKYIHYEYISDEDLAHCSFISVYVPMSRHDQLGWTTDYHEMEWYRAAGLSFTGW